jgi:hypothetical protein
LRENFTSSFYGEGLETGGQSQHRASPFSRQVNHREEKDTLGVGQAQLGDFTAAPKQPVLSVAAYRALLFASIRAFGAGRGPVYAKLPKWRRRARRPSCLDLIALLRIEMAEQPQLPEPFGFEISAPAMTRAAAA